MEKENGATKICKYCKSEIPADAKVCPQCRKKQRGKGCLIAIIVVVVLCIIGVAAGGSGSSGVDNSNAVSNADTGSAQTTAADNSAEDKDTADETEEDSEQSNVVEVGGTYNGDGLSFTVKDADMDYQVDDPYGFYELGDGMKYVSVDFKFENTGDSDQYVSIYDFDCYADDEACEQQYISDSDDFMNTNLSAGRSVSFTAFYAVPEDASSIELEYTANIWTSEKIFVKLK